MHRAINDFDTWFARTTKQENFNDHYSEQQRTRFKHSTNDDTQQSRLRNKSAYLARETTSTVSIAVE